MARTTLALDDRILERIREKSRREKRTIQDCTNELLRRALEVEDGAPVEPPAPLPVFSLGAARVDVADRDALYTLLDTE